MSGDTLANNRITQNATDLFVKITTIIECAIAGVYLGMGVGVGAWVLTSPTQAAVICLILSQPVTSLIVSQLIIIYIILFANCYVPNFTHQLIIFVFT